MKLLQNLSGELTTLVLGVSVEVSKFHKPLNK